MEGLEFNIPSLPRYTRISSITSDYKAQSLRGSAMTSQFRWPFSLRYLYTVDELRPSSQPPLSTPIAASQRPNQHHTFEWPFSLKYLYTVDEFRLGSSSTPPSKSSVVADVPTLPGKRGSTSVEVEATPVVSSSSSRRRKPPHNLDSQGELSDLRFELRATERAYAKEVFELKAAKRAQAKKVQAMQRVSYIYFLEPFLPREQYTD
jgi:hypothetical protein